MKLGRFVELVALRITVILQEPRAGATRFDLVMVADRAA
jgi:hypothetical protein